MYNRYIHVGAVVAMVIICYLIMLIVIPFLADVTLTVNSSLNASHNMSGDYPGTSPFLVSIPWILFFIPGVIGIAAIVVILRQQIWS